MDQPPDQQPHDVLAAEEFAFPTPEDHPSPPPDEAPHDVLAAEEFAFPAADDRGGAGRSAGRRRSLWLGAGAAGALAVAAALRRRSAG